eukprot:2507141-Pyramimonas_sp.AAC.1
MDSWAESFVHSSTKRGPIKSRADIDPTYCLKPENPCGATFEVQARWYILCDASYAVQYTWRNQYGAMFAV